MLRKIEKNAKSKEEALELAAKELGVSVDELSYKVEREVGKGLMGFLLGKEVVISAWITKEAEEEERRIKEISDIAKQRAHSDKAQSKSENPYAPKAEPIARDYAEKTRAAKPAEQKEEPKAKAEAEKADEPALTNADKSDDKASKKQREVTEKSLEDAKYFAENLVRMMGLSDAKVNVVNSGKSVDVDVSGSRMGLLIGKRGDTLDAVQYLTSIYVNKEKNSYIKVNVDTENYRSKREETLVKLARSLERRVIREGAAVTLEPMSPNERRIIHSALQNSSNVKTYSIGEEPHRKVVVDLK